MFPIKRTRADLIHKKNAAHISNKKYNHPSRMGTYVFSQERRL